MHPTDVHLHSEEMAACNYILTACVKSSTVECDAGGVGTNLRQQGDVTGTSNLATIVLPFTLVYTYVCQKKVSENSNFKSYENLPELKRYSAHMNPGGKTPEAFAEIETIRTRFPQPLLSMP